jgi:hypothetical protein
MFHDYLFRGRFVCLLLALRQVDDSGGEDSSNMMDALARLDQGGVHFCLP